MASTNSCSECGAEISPGAQGNLCRRCLFALATLTEQPGDVIGRYTLLQKIGEGGCGVVYMAEQEEPIRRRVALKVIKLGMDTRDVIARFEAERQALALMDHPGIAKIIDAGATEAGRPFFAMELVRGIKITDYCDQNNVSADERLKLFIQVCQAVQHAHQKGIIHRDIKPSNVLVTLHDGVPVPKIIDFGIAKAIEGRLTDKTLFTQFQQFIGTPAYMSPEQAEMSGLDIDTRSDIYSLGVLLYELLTSNTPFDSQTLLRAGLDEMRRIIREEDPAKPSTRLSTLAAEELSVVARKRHCAPQALNNLVRGELDWIVMKALEKDRTRRYESASAFARDIQRHLQDEPVRAAAPSTFYTFQKFARRHKVALATATTMAALLLAAAIISTRWAIQALRAEDKATIEARKSQRLLVQATDAEKIARTEESKSQQVAQFLKAMLKGVGPSFALGRDTKMLQEILDKTAARLGKDLKDQPEVEAELRTTVGQVYTDLEDYPKAEMMFVEALALQKKRWGDEHLDVADSLQNLAYVLQTRGELDEAEKMLKETLRIRKKLLGNEHASVASALSHLARVFHIQRKLAEAEEMHREALSMRKRLLGDKDKSVADSLHSLANVLWSRGKQGEAEDKHREALAMRRNLLGGEDPAVAASLMELGRALRGQGKLAEAEDKYREALATRRKLFSNEHQSVHYAVTRLIDVLQSRGKLPEAEQLLNEFLTPAVQSQSRSAGLLRLRGNLRARLARWKEAAADLSKVVQLAPAEHQSWFQLAPLLIESGDLAGYRQHCHEMLARFSGTTDPQVAERIAKAGLLLPAMTGEDLTTASRMAETASIADKDSGRFPQYQFTKGLAEYRQDHLDRAAECAKKALAKDGRDSHCGAQSYLVLAMAHHQWSEANEARVALAEAVEISKMKAPKTSGDLTDEWPEGLISLILLREARTLIGSAAAVPLPAR